MKKNKGFASFEFYFVMSIIGIVMLVGLQRYIQLGAVAKRYSFEAVAQNFTASVYNFHAQWILSRQSLDKNNTLDIHGVKIHFTDEGWPLSVGGGATDQVTLYGCYQLWLNLLQNPAPISYGTNGVYGDHPYHLFLIDQYTCRYEFISEYPKQFYFDYFPLNGQVVIHSLDDSSDHNAEN